MEYVSNDRVLELIRIALDEKGQEPVYDIQEVHSIVYQPKEDCIYGEIVLSSILYEESTNVKFKICENLVHLYQEIITVGEGGEIDSSYFFFPIYNLKELSNLLDEFNEKQE